MLFRLIPLMVVTIAAGALIASINSKDKTPEINVLPIVNPLIGLAVASGLYRGINRQKKLFESYRLTLTDNMITREQDNTPTVSIYFNEITEIVKNKHGSFLIRGKASNELIIVPSQIDDYPDLEHALAQLKPATRQTGKPSLAKYSALIAILGLMLMITVYTVSNKIMVAISGTLLVSILLWSFYEARRSKNIDAKTKRAMWWVWVVIVSVASVTIMKILGYAAR